MRDIAKGVGVEAASLYNHIKSKQEILHELLFDVAGRFTTGMDEISDSSLNPLQKLEKLISLHVRLAVEHTDAVSIIIGEWVHLEEAAKNEYTGLRDTYEEKFKAIIQDCISEGHFKQVNPEIALFSILSTLRWLYSWYSRNREISSVELEKQMIECLLVGLKK